MSEWGSPREKASMASVELVAAMRKKSSIAAKAVGASDSGVDAMVRRGASECDLLECDAMRAQRYKAADALLLC